MIFLVIVIYGFKLFYNSKSSKYSNLSLLNRILNYIHKKLDETLFNTQIRFITESYLELVICSNINMTQVIFILIIFTVIIQCKRRYCWISLINIPNCNLLFNAFNSIHNCLSIQKKAILPPQIWIIFLKYKHT